SLMLLLLAPFGLNFVAALLGSYPYGGCCRLSQHLAPTICLLAGVGAAHLLTRSAAAAGAHLRRMRYLTLALGLFALVLFFTQAYAPFHDGEALWSHKVAGELDRLMQPGDSIVVLNGRDDVWPILRWHLARTRRVSFNGGTPAAAGRVWVLDCG